MKQKILLISTVFIFIFSVFYITLQFIEPPVKKELTIATGSKNGTYYKTALKYKELLKEENIKLNIISSDGSLENIDLLKSHKADIAFVQNGIIQVNSSLEFLANIYYEPLWIFYKNNHYSIDYIIQFINKKISIGKAKSGTNYLSRIILKDNGLNFTNTKIMEYSTQEGAKLLLENKIDALFIVSSPKAKIVRQLLEDPKINLLSIKRAQAYNQKYSYVQDLKLYEGTMDLYKNLPDENINLLATTANLVTRKDIPHELIRIFLKKVKIVHEKKSLFSKDHEFPNLNNTKLTINEEANKYFKNGDSWLEKIFPYWIASNIDRLKLLLIPLLTLLFPLFKGAFPLYIWSMRSKIYKWYKTLDKIDTQETTLSEDELKNKLKELNELKHEIKNETKVPLSFKAEYYNLILHIDLVHLSIKNMIEEKKS